MRYIFIAILALMSGIMFSCGGNANSSDSQNEIEVNDGNESFSVEVVYCYHANNITKIDGKPVLFFASRCFILRNSSGEIVKFDNDANYSEFCSAIWFMKDCTWSSERISRELIGMPTDVNRSSWLKSHPDKVDEANDIYHQSSCAIISGVIDYLQGHKDKITNQDVFKTIDKAYYDTHPLEQSFYQTESSYNYKSYKSNHGRTLTANSSDYSNWFVYLFADGTNVPDGTLIFE